MSWLSLISIDGKCSRIRFRLVSASRSIEITWFGPVLYTNSVKIEFLAKFMVFHTFFCFKTTNRTLRRRSEQQIWSISNIFKVSISQGIQPNHDWDPWQGPNGFKSSSSAGPHPRSSWWWSRTKCKVPSYPLLNTVSHIPYMIYDRKMMIGYYWLSKFSLKEFFFSEPQKEFSIWSLRVKIFLNRPQKLKKLGFESFKNTPLKIRSPRHVRIQGNYNLQIPIVVTSSLLAFANFRKIFSVRKIGY